MAILQLDLMARAQATISHCWKDRRNMAARDCANYFCVNAVACMLILLGRQCHVMTRDAGAYQEHPLG